MHDRQAAPGAPRDAPTVSSDGRLLIAIEGVELHRLAPLVDHRGSMLEVINMDVPFWREPIVHAYQFSILPGRIKGWGMHKLQADRYFSGGARMRVVLFDGRDDSPTQGNYAQFYFAVESPGLLRIPPGVWHADQNIGDYEARILNFPTHAYDYANPDKYRIDPASGEIPFDWTLADG